MNALGALRPFARAWRPAAPPGAGCQVCAQPIGHEQHEHLVDLDRRSLLCACQGCADLFAQPAAAGRVARSSGGARYRVVPKRVLADPAFRLDEAQWAALQIPVRLAFLFFNSRLERWVVLYPSPAGAAESELRLEAVDRLAGAMPLFTVAQPDVEALLVYSQRGGGFETFLVPIEACYRLVGRVRLHWQGFHGGDRAWQEIDAFFAELRAQARTPTGLRAEATR